jgi:ferric-dicitrate binding protein FerR (iron transport regulator)
VLGTAFLVERYRADRLTRVVVTEGRVSLQSRGPHAAADAHAVLTAGTLGVVTDSGTVSIAPAIAMDRDTAWMSGTLVFRGTPASEVVAELGRIYDVEIHLSDSTLAAHPLTWSVPIAKQTLGQVLEALTTLLDSRAKQSGRIITIVPGTSASLRRSNPGLPNTPSRQYGL